MAKLSLVFLLGCMSNLSVAGEAPVQRCRTPPKVILPDAKNEYPSSTARLPAGIVELEFTVTTDGTIQDVLVVKPVDSRLQRWAIEQAQKLRYRPIAKACRTRVTLESRVTDAADGA